MGVPSGAQDFMQSLRARFSQNTTGNQLPFGTDFKSEDEKEAMKWLSEAEGIVRGNVSASAKLEVLNVYLQSRTVFVGNGTRLTLADIGMFVAIRDSVVSLPEEEQEKLPNLFRWFDYVQNKEEVRQVYGLIPIKKSSFFPPNLNALDPVRPAKTAVPSNGKNVNGDKENKQIPAKPEVPTQEAPRQAEKENKEKQVKSEKKEKPPAQKKEVDCDVSVLDICVGQIKKVWKHPSADALYVEEIDVGEPKPRQIVSGLVKYVSEDEMLNRRVLVLLNIKPGKVRDVMSSGLVLCASNEDHTKCEPVAPPASAKVGERVKFAGHDWKPEDVLNPKKKQWEKIVPELRTDAEGVANYQGVPFETSGGVCKSSITNGLIK